ncbi:hypothetical protein DFH09DRAFT_1340295 [Mycena vulgaris]|nr:hypothetical protein DFH09DRAFT_1340295 [Mycena vulgaris]
MSDSSSTPEPENSSCRGTIFKYSSRLAKLSLHPQELECYTLQPRGSWLEFLEKRVRPMIYFLHVGVTHDFALVGRKGYYGREEFAEIWYWMEQVFLHLVRSSSCLYSSAEILNPLDSDSSC